jgi:osmotically-inducible protein OsmY
MSHYLSNAKPTSYTNSQDADLIRRLVLAFSMHPRQGWRDIQIIVRHGLETLIGEVPTFHSRQLLVAVARHVAGVLRVSDELRVVDLPTRKPRSAKEALTETVDRPRVNSKVAESSHALAHIPVSNHSLEDIVAASLR